MIEFIFAPTAEFSARIAALSLEEKERLKPFVFDMITQVFRGIDSCSGYFSHATDRIKIIVAGAFPQDEETY